MEYYDPNDLTESELKKKGYTACASIEYLRKDKIFIPGYRPEQKLYLIPLSEITKIEPETLLVTTEGKIFEFDGEIIKPLYPFGHYEYGVVK